MAVCQCHGDRASQHGHHSNQQVSGDQPCPSEHRHLHQSHARRAHVQDGHDDVDRTHDRRGTQDVHGKNTSVHRWTHLQSQRCVQGPTRSRCTTGHEERTDQHGASRNHQPEAEVVHAGKGHVRRANLQRQHPVRKAHKGGHDRAEHHDDAVHGGELVEQFRVDNLQARLKQLSADAQSQHAANHEHGETEQQVQSTNVFVVGGIHPATPARRRVTVVVMGVIVMV